MDSLSQMMAEDAQASLSRLPTDVEMFTVAELVTEQLRLEDEVAKAEANLKVLQAQLVNVSEKRLPEAIELFGFKEFKLVDGRTVSIKEEVHAGITKENQEQAFAWLEETGNDGIIKNQVKLQFGKGQGEEVEELTSLLNEKGFTYTNDRSVHHSTLKAFVTKQLEQGAPIPSDVFSIHVQKISHIRIP